MWKELLKDLILSADNECAKGNVSEKEAEKKNDVLCCLPTVNFKR